MIDLNSPADLELLRESIDLECKLAVGRDGQGALPEDFWPTYSAFANTNGGMVLLGVREKKGQFQLEGIANPAKVRKELFDNLNNRKQVSINLLSDSSVREVELDGRTLLLVEVPRASRKQRPVFLTPNPFGHTYRRLNDGDRLVSDEEVKRMLAEQVEDSRDDCILKGYHLDDLCVETLRAYRQVFANRDPAHPWNALDDQEFLRQIGGWRRDRETDTAGMTLAGLLMFGWMSTIQEALPNYMLDYQERPEARTELRWVDRVTLDGKWSGNIFDFYRKVYLKLTADLKVPFKLEKGERQDETPVHVALREALANVLVHADYSDRASVLVVKRPDMFGFRNPGLMVYRRRLPFEAVNMTAVTARCTRCSVLWGWVSRLAQVSPRSTPAGKISTGGRLPFTNVTPRTTRRCLNCACLICCQKRYWPGCAYSSALTSISSHITNALRWRRPPPSARSAMRGSWR